MAYTLWCTHDNQVKEFVDWFSDPDQAVAYANKYDLKQAEVWRCSDDGDPDAMVWKRI
jgi:hypothetical protein